ncbi:MAG: hypothetical protein KJ984_03810 [Nanoarchaeota archaeon]|nr:hypothetical protein [Nanoarchaeota archaeon]
MENKNEQIGQNKPIVETHIGKSKDGKYIIHKTIITDIKPVKYYEVVMKSDNNG